MAWIESHQTLKSHPKTKKLARKLSVSIPAAIGHLHCLWWWALDYADDGDLSQYDYEDITDAAMWDVKDTDAFINAMTESGFLDKTDNGYVIHDWYDYAGKLIERRKANVERARKWRENRAKQTQNDESTDTNESRMHNKQIRTDNESATYDATVPNRTVPNQKNKNNNAQARSSESARKAARTKFVKDLFNNHFWPMYPRKKAKQDALKAFLAIFPISVSKEQCNRRWTHIMMHVEALKAEGRPLDKIPYPATFLRAEDFDEPPAEPSINDDDGPIFEEVE